MLRKLGDVCAMRSKAEYPRTDMYRGRSYIAKFACRPNDHSSAKDGLQLECFAT